MNDTASFLCRHIVSRGLASEEDIRKAQAIREEVGGRLHSILVRIGAVSEEGMLEILSELLDMEVAAPQIIPFDPEPLLSTVETSGIPLDWWLDQEVFAWMDDDDTFQCILRDPFDDSAIEILHRALPDRKLKFLLARSQDIDRVLDLMSRKSASYGFAHDDIRHLREMAEEAPVISFVNTLFAQAFEQRASDIHIEPDERVFEVRYRIDGILYTRFSLPKERFPAVCSRVKLISGMDIAERRLPQDGRLSLRLRGEEVDVRVSSAPGVHGESVVMRLLPKESQRFTLDSLGFQPDNLELLNRWILEPHGIILVTGPTGSGKSTTLYAILETINDRKRKIITVEDPVEYQLQGITQIQTHTEIGYTFARALRSILRQDPDVILIGEIRDGETAEIAVQASLTGHLVLSTLHTNDAVSAFTRLIDMGIEPFLVATPVKGVMAQRLVRRLCPHCAEPMTPLKEIREMVEELLPPHCKASQPRWLKPVGCPRCKGAGYLGREGIYEIVPVTPDMQHLILGGQPTSEMRRLAKAQNQRTLREDGLLKAWSGITSVEEVLRVTAE